jgi:Zn-dependent M16 (insulinase) family peptidase
MHEKRGFQMSIHGFTLEREERIEEYASTAKLYVHDKTGAHLLSIENDDENKVFGVSFRTPPRDSTGVAHILEHSVLCGSRKYPVKEPFVELLKGSLQTFLNAFTYPDKTCYPVASTNEQDFVNLIDVYFDAVFHPRITKHIFEQEGWHYELEKPEGPLSYKGVVYNEMKGAYSSPISVLYEHTQRELFPDTTYGLDSGGEPEVIPELTFEQFSDFHARYYHPSNAYIYFYGDFDPEKRLELAAAYLDEYESRPVDSHVEPQASFPKPRRKVVPFAVDEGDDKGFVNIAWLLGDVTDVDANLRWQVLEEILIGMPSSPLRKALIDSGLGEDLTGGLENELRQMFFAAGLKGVDPARADDVGDLIFATLGRIADEGVETSMVEAALNTIEFDLRENNTGRFPRGLSLMVRALTTWLYDDDPLATLRFEAPLARLKADLEAGEKVFENMIRTELLDNPHRVDLVLEPDTMLGTQRQLEEDKRLKQALAAMSESERLAVIAETETLHKLQGSPDSPVDLAKIPRLHVADLPRENQHVPTEEAALSGVRTMVHDLETNGIVYLDLAFDLAGLHRELIPWVGLFGRALVEMGTEREDYVSLGRRIAKHTGGISPSSFANSVRGTDDTTMRLALRAKCIVEKTPELLAILRDVLRDINLDDRDRFRQIALEQKARLEQRVVPAGHGLVMTRLGASFGPAGLADELMGGVEQLFFVRRLVERIETDWPTVLEELERIRSLVIRRGGLVANLTLDGDNAAAMTPALTDFLAELPDAAAEPIALPTRVFPGREGLTIPAQINYVGKAADLAAAGWQASGQAVVVARALRTAYLWDRIRVQGGAYGCFCQLNAADSTLSMVSYRDPNVENTLQVYDDTATFLRETHISNDELEKAIIGAIGDIDAYQLPDAKGWSALVRELSGRDEAWRDQLRVEALATTAEDFAAFAEAADILREQGRIAILGRRERLEQAQEALGTLDMTKVL